MLSMRRPNPTERLPNSYMGNSGGALLDSSGQLIGMNTAIYSPTGASAGIGFAIPVDTLKYQVDTIIKNGKV